jgi:DNA mismatch endonuclease (patch repair protein)
VRVVPDLVFGQERLAVFIDGCFWHGCSIHGVTPKVNTQYWLPKLWRNRQRDALVSNALQRAGWKCLRIWEHVGAEEAAALIQVERAKCLR